MANGNLVAALEEAATTMMQLSISSADERKTSIAGKQSSTAAGSERFSFSAITSVETKPLPPAAAAASNFLRLSHEEFEEIWARWRELAAGAGAVEDDDDEEIPDHMVQAQIIGPSREVDYEWVDIFGSE